MDNSSGSGLDMVSSVNLLQGGSMSLARTGDDNFDQICHSEDQLSEVKSNEHAEPLIDKSSGSGNTGLLPGGVNLQDLLRNPVFIAQVNSMFGTTLYIDGLPRFDANVQPMIVRNTGSILDSSLAVNTDDSLNVMTKVMDFLSSSVGCSTKVICPDKVCVEENICTLAQIYPDTPTPWRVRVRAIEKGFPRLSRNPVNPITYLRCILMDEEGNRVQATIFGEDIDLMGKKLNLLRMCFVCNAIVQTIHVDHRVVPNEFQWTISAKTSCIEPIMYDSSYQIRNSYNLVSFTRFDDYLNSFSTIDVLGAVVNVLPMKKINTTNGLSSVQEVLLVDQMLKPITLTLWDQFVDYEGLAIREILHEVVVIVATRVRVTSYKGASLCTKSSSSILINLDFAEANDLR